MRKIHDILDDINSKIDIDCTKHGLCTLQEKDGQVFPIINQGSGQGKQISPRDNFQIYHRILDSETESDPALGKGKFPYTIRVYSMRLVGIGNMRTSDNDINDRMKNDVFDQIPQILSGKELVIPGDENIIRNDVMGSEFAPAENWSKYGLDLIAFYIDYEIKQRICPTRN